MTILLCTCGETFESLIVDDEIQIVCGTCDPFTWGRLKRAQEAKAS